MYKRLQDVLRKKLFLNFVIFVLTNFDLNIIIQILNIQHILGNFYVIKTDTVNADMTFS